MNVPTINHTLKLLTALLLAPLAALHAANKPNVLFILADDLGWSDTTLYGKTKFYQTPNIERLAQRGMTFVNAYAANPLCSPTRASIMTGLYPGRIGITLPICHVPQVQLEERMINRVAPYVPVMYMVSASRLKTEYYTLAEAMKEAGYSTAHFGKWHLGYNIKPTDHYEPKDQGFDLDFPHTPSVPGPAGGYLAPWKFIKNPSLAANRGTHIEDRMAEEAAQFIRDHKDKPFFLNYWAFSVHGPFSAKPDLVAKYRQLVDLKDEQRCPVYGAMVQSLDENVGRLLDTLDELKLAQNTIIVFFSDNGGNMYNRVPDIPPTSNCPLRGGKGTIYEGGTREPCVVAWPGKVKPGSRTDALLSSVDWYPTLIEMTGVKLKPDVKFDGVSQTPALLGTGAPRDTVFCYYPHYTRATGAKPSVYVRRGDWKLIRFYCDSADQSDRFELYNLKDDIGEAKNLAAAEPALVQELNALIDGFHKQTGALVPAKNPSFNPALRPASPDEDVHSKKSPPEEKDVRTELERESDADVIQDAR